MSIGAIIVLIIVVWLFLLAPWLLRSQRPVKHTGEAFDDTRVLFNGDSGEVLGSRRPRLSPRDVHVSADELDAVNEYADDAVAHDDAPVDFSEGNPDEARSRDDAHASEDGSRMTIKRAAANAKAAAGARFRRGTERDADVASDDAEDDALVDEPVFEESMADAKNAPELDVVADEVEVFTAPAPEAAEDAYAYDDSYTSPVDLLYPGAVDPAPAVDAEVESEADPVGGDSADAEAEVAEEAQADTAETEGEAHEESDTDLSNDELEFAQRRLGRGGWDPVADSAARVTRYQRRQRVLVLFAVLDVAAVALGIVVGGWTWWIAAILGIATVAYLVALRNQTRAETELRRRRVKALRRARLGVRTAQDEELAIPRKLRRPGAVVLEVDDESPDFDFLPVYDLRGPGDDDLGGAHVVNRRELRDELSARRAG
ncbi:gephyrin-like molybdotransferase receptor GlpR [Corynebacterium phoceense]|uniref:divisome protein SepX/GlpR n=1 Tax=Corynebacterium phoceense TaxID=1686286 RepID=UPI0034CE4D9B